VIAYLLHPIADRIEKLLKGPLGRLLPQRPKQAQGLAKGISIFASLVFALLLIWALIAMVLPQLIDSIAMIVRNMPSYYNTLSKWVMDLIDDNLEMANLTEDIMNEVYSYLSSFLKNTVLPGLQTAVASLTSSVVGMAKGLLNLVIGVIISVYLLSGRGHLLAQAKKTCYAVLGKRRGGYLCNVCTYANRVFGSFIGGKLLDSLIIGILCFLGLSILDMPYTMLISIIVGVTNIIPFFGPYLGAIPSALLLLVIDPMEALYFIIFILVLQQIDGNIIGPVILGDATGLGSLWVVVAILVFGGLFGIFGMVIGVPLFAVLYKIASELINKLLEERGLSTATADYEQWNYPPRNDSAKWNPPSRRQKKKAKKAQTQAPQEPESQTQDSEET
jgi:predicted PurR-regulated permease PerM